MKLTSFIPEGYQRVTPYLIVHDGTKAIEFYKKIFSATKQKCMLKPNGKIAHAELQIGDTMIMLSDEYPEMDVLSPKSSGKTSIFLHIYVEDVDKVIDAAVKAGAQLIRPPENMFYGDRIGSINDPFGHQWSIATHKEDVSLDEMKKRAEKFH